MIIETLYTFSDEARVSNPRLPFHHARFLGLELHNAVPDPKATWLFRQQLDASPQMKEESKAIKEALIFHQKSPKRFPPGFSAKLPVAANR